MVDVPLNPVKNNNELEPVKKDEQVRTTAAEIQGLQPEHFGVPAEPQEESPVANIAGDGSLVMPSIKDLQTPATTQATEEPSHFSIEPNTEEKDEEPVQKEIVLPIHSQNPPIIKDEAEIRQEDAAPITTSSVRGEQPQVKIEEPKKPSEETTVHPLIIHTPGDTARLHDARQVTDIARTPGMNQSEAVKQTEKSLHEKAPITVNMIGEQNKERAVANSVELNGKREFLAEVPAGPPVSDVNKLQPKNITPIKKIAETEIPLVQAQHELMGDYNRVQNIKRPENRLPDASKLVRAMNVLKKKKVIEIRAKEEASRGESLGKAA